PACRAVEHEDRRGSDLGVGSQPEDRILFDERQNLVTPVPALGSAESEHVGRIATARGILPPRGGEYLYGIVVVMAAQGQLLEVVLTLRPGGGAAHLLHRRHQQSNQDGNDGNDDQELDEREPATPAVNGL